MTKMKKATAWGSDLERNLIHMIIISDLKYKKIRGWLASEGLTYEWLGKRLGRSESYVKQRMNSTQQWSLKDCYTILKLMELDEKYFFEVFPPEEVGVKL